MSALLLSALSGSWCKGSVALSANHFVTFVFSCKGSQSWLDFDGSSATTSKSEDEMESRFLLDVVVAQGSAIFQLLSSEDESLLVGRNTFLILNFSPKEKLVKRTTWKSELLDIVNGVALFDIQSNCLSCQSLNEDLHFYCVWKLI